MTRRWHILGPHPTLGRLAAVAALLMACVAGTLIAGLELAGVSIWRPLLTEIGLRP